MTNMNRDMSQIRGRVPPNINYFNNSNSASNMPKYLAEINYADYGALIQNNVLDVAVDYVSQSNPNGTNPNNIQKFLSYNDGPGMKDLRPNRINP